MKFAIVPVTPYQQNCSLIWCEKTLEAAIVDPGGDIPRILAAVKKHGVRPVKILLTHGHIDHAGGTAQLARELAIPIEGPHPDESFWIDALPQQSAMFGFGTVEVFTPDRWLHQGDTVTVGSVELAVRHCPGHTPGHVVFFDPVSRIALVGDVLFQGSIGRTDFPRGDYDTLIRSIREQLWPLGDDVAFIPGHGPMSNIRPGAAQQPLRR